MELWRIKVNEFKSFDINFTVKRGHCPEVKLNGNALSQSKEVK